MAEARFFVRAKEGALEKGPFSFAQIKESHRAKRLADGALVRPDDASFDSRTVRDLLIAKEDERTAMLVSFARQDEAAEERHQKRMGNTKVILGIACIVAGVTTSAASYASASEAGGGRYIVFTGLFVFGLAQLLRGL